MIEKSELTRLREAYSKVINPKSNKSSSKLNEGVEDIPRLSKSILGVLNKQIMNELESSQIYRALSAWLNDNDWVDGTKLFFKYANEELDHMSKIYTYIYEKNSRAVVPPCPNVKQEFKDIREVVESALNHEMMVTKNWNDIANKSKEENDNDTYSFAMGYINEQREEEEKVRDVLEKMNLDMPKWAIDELFGELIK